MSLRDDIEGALDLAFRDVQVPEWKGRTVRVRELCAEDRVLLEDEIEKAKEANGGKAESSLRGACRLLARALLDPETGEQIATFEVLCKRSTRVILRLFTIAAEVSALGEKGVEKEVGGSGAVPSGASPTN